MSVRFRVRGGYEVVAIDLLGAPVGPLSPPFARATAKWADVVDSHLAHNPIDRNCVWRLVSPSAAAGSRTGGGADGDRDGLVIGVDIPLGDTLAKWLPASADEVELLLPGPMHLPVSVEYEKMRYARGALRAGLVWPAWARDDTDPINMQPLGEWENQRDRRGVAGEIDADQNNGIENLVGLQSPDGNIVRFVNIANLVSAIDAGMRPPEENPYQRMTVRDPAFGSVIADPHAMADALRTMSSNAREFGAADSGWFLFIWKLGASHDAESKKTGFQPIDTKYMDAFDAENSLMRAELKAAAATVAAQSPDLAAARDELLAYADGELQDAYDSVDDGWGEADVGDILESVHLHDAWSQLDAREQAKLDERIRRLFAAGMTFAEADLRTPVRRPETAAAAAQLDAQVERGSLVARYRRAFLLHPDAEPSGWLFDAAPPDARKKAKTEEHAELYTLSDAVGRAHRAIQTTKLPFRGDDESIQAFEGRMRAYRDARAKELAAIIVPEQVTGKLFGRMCTRCK